jgi:hypothetical protein
MGWYGTNNQTRADLARELTKTWENETARVSSVAHTFKGSTLWVVHEETIKATGEVSRYVVAYMNISKSEGTFGYKPVSEDMGPYDDTVPLGYIDKLAPISRGEYSEQWRARVRAYHAEKKRAADLRAAIKPGARVQLSPRYGSRVYTIESVIGSKVRATNEQGHLYRLVRKNFEGATVL